MATARGEQEAFHRPCLQKQSQKRTHRQPQLRIRLQRHQRPFRFAPRSIGLSRVPTRSMRCGGAAFWQVALGSCTESRAFLRGAGHFRERGAVAASLSFPRLGPRPPTNPRRGPQNPRRREHSRHLTRAPPRAPYSRRSDRTHTSPPPPRPPAALEEAAPRPDQTN